MHNRCQTSYYETNKVKCKVTSEEKHINEEKKNLQVAYLTKILQMKPKRYYTIKEHKMKFCLMFFRENTQEWNCLVIEYCIFNSILYCQIGLQSVYVSIYTLTSSSTQQFLFLLIFFSTLYYPILKFASLIACVWNSTSLLVFKRYFCDYYCS
jgi:hypothetical protein